MYKNWFENKKAVIFDLDGTIIKSHELWKDSILEILNNKIDFYTSNPRKFLTKGSTNKKKWKTLKNLYSLKKLNLKEVVEETDNTFIELVKTKDLEVMEGFWRFSAELKLNRNYKLGLSTNSSRKVADFVLDHLGMNNVFDVSLCGDEVRKPKPKPQMYKKLVKKLGLKKKEVLVFEDSVTGAKAANKAGLDVAIIWDMETEKYKFPYKSLGFVPDFQTFLGLMDKTPEELLFQAAQETTQNT